MNDKKTEKSNESDDKILNSFYVLTETLEKLEDFLFYAKKRLPVERRRKLTKSLFYEACVLSAIADYNAKGEESSLWKAIYELMNDG